MFRGNLVQNWPRIDYFSLNSGEKEILKESKIVKVVFAHVRR